MSRNVVMIPQQMSLQGAARIFSRAQISGAPVVDAEGRCVGILSATDYMHLAETEGAWHPQGYHSPTCKPWQIVEAEDHSATPLVADAMNRDPVMVPAQTSVRKVAYMMIDAHIRRVVVVDHGDRPIGIVSSTDILGAVARSEDESRNRRAGAISLATGSRSEGR